MDRFQVTSRLTEFWIDAGKSATITNIGSSTVYGSPDAPPTSTATAAWSLAPGATRTEDVGAVWVLTASGTSSTLTVEPIASGLAVDTGTGVPSAVGSSGGSGSVSAQALGNLGATATLTLTTQNTIASARLTANCALTISGLVAGSQGTIGVQQDGTGSRTLTINGSAVTLPAAANAFGSVQFWSVDGTNLYVQGAPQVGGAGPTGPTGPTGATGPSGPSGSARLDVLNNAAGVISQSQDRAIAFRQATIAAGQLHGSLVPLQAGDVISSVVIEAVAAQGAAPTGAYVAIYSTAGSLLAVSANLNTDTKWATTGPKVFALTTPYTAATSQAVYVCVSIIGSWATVQPAFTCGARQDTALSTAITGGVGHAIFAGSQSGAPPSSLGVLGTNWGYYGPMMIWGAVK